MHMLHIIFYLFYNIHATWHYDQNNSGWKLSVARTASTRGVEAADPGVEHRWTLDFHGYCSVGCVCVLWCECCSMARSETTRTTGNYLFPMCVHFPWGFFRLHTGKLVFSCRFWKNAQENSHFLCRLQKNSWGNSCTHRKIRISLSVVEKLPGKFMNS